MNEPRLLLPPMDAVPWPTLGNRVADWIEAKLCHGPGDILGRPIGEGGLTDEEYLFLLRVYEVHAKGTEHEGRRRFKRAVYSRRKGVRKSELAAWITLAEFDPTSPVRCIGWEKDEKGVWVPVGGAVRDPYIPLIATTEEQTEDLVYGAVKAILENCELGNSYVIGQERIMHRDEPGVIKALAGAPNARDGARTSFQGFDETHGFTSDRLRKATATMLRNMAKRFLADPWSLESTTMYGPGEDSVAEASHLYAEQVKAGLVDDPRLLFDHRQASETHDLDTIKGLRAAIIEASGDAILWTDIEAIMSQYREAAANRDEHAKNEFRRYFLNQRRSLIKRAYPVDLWNSRKKKRKVAEQVRIVLSFDGSYSRDSTALLGTTVEETPHIFVIKAWEKPAHDSRWRTPVLEVEAEVEEAMETYEVVEFAPDPPGWKHEVEAWELKYGEVVVRFETNQPSRMGPACDAFDQAMRGDEDTHEGGFTHDGDERLTRHISHCVTVKRGRYQLVTKEHPDSPLKIDLAIGAIVGFDRATWHHVNQVEAGDPGWAFV